MRADNRNRKARGQSPAAKPLTGRDAVAADVLSAFDAWQATSASEAEQDISLPDKGLSFGSMTGQRYVPTGRETLEGLSTRGAHVLQASYDRGDMGILDERFEFNDVKDLRTYGGAGITFELGSDKNDVTLNLCSKNDAFEVKLTVTVGLDDVTVVKLTGNGPSKTVSASPGDNIRISLSDLRSKGGWANLYINPGSEPTDCYL